jgi:hypothetical protein
MRRRAHMHAGCGLASKAFEKRDHSQHACLHAVHRTKSETTDTPLALLPRRPVFLLPLWIFINHSWVATNVAVTGLWPHRLA